VSLVEQDLLTPQNHPNRPTLLSDVRVAQSLYFLCSVWYLPTFLILKFGFRFVVFNATFNNISAISWRSVLLVEETGVSGENHRPCRKSLYDAKSHI
jgi:hypothetical protein